MIGLKHQRDVPVPLLTNDTPLTRYSISEVSSQLFNVFSTKGLTESVKVLISLSGKVFTYV